MDISKEQLTDLQKRDHQIRAAIAEDAVIRDQSVRRSKAYMDAVEVRDGHMPEWMWNMLWFILGGFAWASIEPTVEIVDVLLKASGFGGFLP